VAGPEAVIARDQWVARGQGYLRTWETRLHYLEFQFREVPGWQVAVTDPRVRQAMTYAVDRPGLAEVVTDGLGTAADAFITRSDPLFPEVDRTITHYPYDVNRATALLAEAGWRAEAGPGQRGQPVANAAGQPLEAEMMVQSRWEQEATIVADYWKAAGISSSIQVLPAARERDREYRASFRAAHLGERTISPDNFYWVSSQAPTPESRFAELNRGSFADPEVDRLQNVVMTSFEEGARRQATLALHKRMSDLAGYIPLTYVVEVILARHAVKGPIGNYGPQVGITWNVFDWELAE
jgi:peptide/nickel transport system substrate-binding protein